MSVYDRNAGTGRKPNLWVKYTVDGETIREPGKGSRKLSAAYEVEQRRKARAGTWVHPKLRRGDRANFAVYARAVVERRTARGVGRNESPPNKSERGHVENHLIPMFGAMRVDELTSFRVVKAAFERFTGGDYAGRTVRNIHSTLRAILVEAAEDGLIDTAPTPLTARRDHLPPPVDSVSFDRGSAQFDRAEVARLVGCEAVASMRRVLYAAYFLTGSRAQELLRLTVGAYTPLQPWPGLTLPASKVGRHAGVRRRHAPVFPELQTWLDWWIADEYAVLFGRAPRAEDLLFPTISVRRRNRGAADSSRNEIYKQWKRNDLPAAGLRHRRLHDSRRTFVGVLRSAGVDDRAIRAVTHASTGDRILDAYTTWEWAGLCSELGKVTWGLPQPPRAADVIQLRGTSGVPVFADATKHRD